LVNEPAEPAFGHRLVISRAPRRAVLGSERLDSLPRAPFSEAAQRAGPCQTLVPLPLGSGLGENHGPRFGHARHRRKACFRGAHVSLGSSRESESRERLLRTRPAVLGASWAKDSCEDAQRQGRRLEGGWPGTVPEARARVLWGLDAELMSRGMARLSSTELGTATTAAYDRAKRDWLLAVRAMGAVAGRVGMSTEGTKRET